VSRRVELPSDNQARQAMSVLLDEAATSGHRPTVVELARRLDLTNTTFWRHYPDLAHELRDRARTPRTPSSPAVGRDSSLEQRNAALARDNHHLREQLDLAIANIARLTLDNDHLRRAVEAQNAITRIHPPNAAARAVGSSPGTAGPIADDP